MLATSAAVSDVSVRNNKMGFPSASIMPPINLGGDIEPSGTPVSSCVSFSAEWKMTAFAAAASVPLASDGSG